MENIHGNDVNPPRSETTAGTAVARIVASMATSPMLSITATRIGPRSLRRPTSARVTRRAVGVLTRAATPPDADACRPLTAAPGQAQPPAHPPGRVDVRVTTPGGTSAKVAADRYSYR